MQGDLAEPLAQLDAGLAVCEQEHAACLTDRPDVAAARSARAGLSQPCSDPYPGASPSAGDACDEEAAFIALLDASLVRAQEQSDEQ